MSADHHDHHRMLQTDGLLLHQQFHWKNKHHYKQWLVYIIATILVRKIVLCTQLTGSWVGPRSKSEYDGKKNIFRATAWSQINVNAYQTQSQHSTSYFCSEGIYVIGLKCKVYATSMKKHAWTVSLKYFPLTFFLLHCRLKADTIHPFLKMTAKLWTYKHEGVHLNIVLLYFTSAWKPDKHTPIKKIIYAYKF